MSRIVSLVFHQCPMLKHFFQAFPGKVIQHLHTIEFYASIKKNKIRTFAENQIELAVISKQSGRDSERQILCFLSYVVIIKLDCQLDRI